MKTQLQRPDPIRGGDDATATWPGLRINNCGDGVRHTPHQWGEPDAFYWCDGLRL